jgi:putative ABC transport system permease protein
MGSYYLHLALRSLRRNVALTALIIAALGVGIGSTMTVFTVLLAMSGDPIPGPATP